MDPSAGNRLTLRETDEADSVTTTFIYSEQDNVASKQPTGRVDVMDSSTAATTSRLDQPLIKSLSDVFLPSGYPHSVSEDYLPSIAGLLSSRAVLQGVGVGNADASPTSALLLHILQDSSGRIATILFAHRVGTALEPECKTYRLAADVFNDIAMILDCLSPGVPAGYMRVTVLSTAGVLRALCGVAGGSSKASLSAHFARWGNLAELNAKDSSQETVISLVGMLVGSLVVSHVTRLGTTWAALLFLLGVHLSMNYAAVRAVQMTSLNRQRANIVFSTLLSSDPDLNIEALRSGSGSTTQEKRKRVSRSSSSKTTPEKWKLLTPAEVAEQERIFPRDGALEWISYQPEQQQQPIKQSIGSAAIGVSLPTFFRNTNTSTTSTNVSSPSSFKTSLPMTQLSTLFEEEAYLFFLCPSSSSSSSKKGKWHASILLKKGCSKPDRLKAWAHALLAVWVLNGKKDASDHAQVLGVVSRTLAFMSEQSRLERYLAALAAAGWDLDVAALETSGGRRVCF
ncbi:hypothetical protein N7474_003953 [Penicillium riverlandense]|uniref:uncharacterized protein n=1 Tax=Penicillium riverlandense TaxID=1903569 RepID=UPI0025473E94|nr:uncharacterized protein N7474_003953 [Penicillium riverlandense]KAJ5818362.1 hypothetical protein N7474_003953 [Penicillium riverlandense]